MGDSYGQFIIYIFTCNPAYFGEFEQQEQIANRNSTKFGPKYHIKFAS